MRFEDLMLIGLPNKKGGWIAQPPFCHSASGRVVPAYAEMADQFLM